MDQENDQNQDQKSVGKCLQRLHVTKRTNKQDCGKPIDERTVTAKIILDQGIKLILRSLDACNQQKFSKEQQYKRHPTSPSKTKFLNGRTLDYASKIFVLRA